MTITTQAVREMVDKLIPTGLVEYRTGELSRLPAECIAMLLALVEERDRLAALTNETMEALQKIGEEFGVYGGERRVDGIRRVLTELRARAEAAEATARRCIQSLRDELAHKYDGQKPDNMHPVTRRAYDRDMAEIDVYLAALQGRDGDA